MTKYSNLDLEELVNLILQDGSELNCETAERLLRFNSILVEMEQEISSLKEDISKLKPKKTLFEAIFEFFD